MFDSRNYNFANVSVACCFLEIKGIIIGEWEPIQWDYLEYLWYNLLEITESKTFVFLNKNPHSDWNNLWETYWIQFINVFQLFM